MSVVSKALSRWFRRDWISALLGLVLVIGTIGTVFAQGAVSLSAQQQPDGAGSVSTVTAEVTDLVSTINATGNVEPIVESKLAFATQNGRVAEVLVHEGQRVEAGEPLVRLETAQLETAVAAASANLEKARADMLGLQEGATAEEVAIAEAQVREAEANYQQTEGQITPAQIAAAAATLEAARAALAELEAGPDNTEVAAARARVDQERANFAESRVALQATRDEYSNKKTLAEQELEAATLQLQQVQANYSTSYWTDQSVQRDGRVPETVDDDEPNDNLTDFGNLEQQEEFRKARLALREAELAVEQATKALELARLAEITAVQQAEQQVASAEASVRELQADLDDLLAGAENDQLVAARAKVLDAEADLIALQGQEHQGALAAQSARLDNAQARLADLLAGPQPSALARAMAGVAAAEAGLQQAQIDLELATLVAPFAGTVAVVGVNPGEKIDQVSPITLIDDSSFQIDLTVDEVNVARLVEGQEVQVLIDALGPPVITGTVQRIAPIASDDKTVHNYAVTVAIDPAGRPVRSGMTASTTIVTAHRIGVVALPSSTVRYEGQQAFVDLVVRDANGNVTLQPQAVTTGLVVGDLIEITSGLQGGEQVVQ